MEENNTIEQYNNALFYLEQGYTQNIDKAIELLTLAAEKGNADAQYRLGALYAEGEFVAEDLETIIYWLDQAARQGRTEAENKLATYLNQLIARHYYSRFCSFGNKLKLDKNEVLSWLEKVASINNPKIQYSIGKIYLSDWDIEKGEEWLTKSAEQDYENAIIELIDVYNYECENNYCNVEKLCYWVKKALSLGIDLKEKDIFLNEKAVFLLEREIDPDSFFKSSSNYKALKTISDNNPLTINFIKNWILDNRELFEYRQYSAIEDFSIFIKRCIYHKTIFQQLLIDLKSLDNMEKVQQWYADIKKRYPDIFEMIEILQSQKMLHTPTPYYEFNLSSLESLKIYFNDEDFKGFFEFYNKISTFFYGQSLSEITEEIKPLTPSFLSPDEAATQYHLALSYFEEGVMQNVDKAIKLLIDAANNDNTNAQRELWKLYSDEQYVPKNVEKAIYWLKRAIKREDIKLLEFLKNKIEFIDDEIISYIEKKAQSGDVETMLFLGEILKDENNYHKRYYWLIEAAKRENHKAIGYLLAISTSYCSYPSEITNMLKQMYWLKRALFLGIDLKEYNCPISLKNKILLKRQNAIGADKIYESKDEKAISELIKRSFLDRYFLQQWLRKYDLEKLRPDDYSYSYDRMFIELYDTLKIIMSYHFTIYQELLKEFEIIKNDKTLLQKYFERIEKRYKYIFTIGNKMLSLNMLCVPNPCYKIPLSDYESINIYFEEENFKDFFEFYSKVLYYYNTYVYELQFCNSEDGVPF
ncbi:tetratricopeptide repeat protein [Capnocytophaga ochracea]|uniref:SEL1-like repeat protein n=1 Tax=Capnocytophaga ochracea TaxID=1018 RepID=A0A2X2SQY2_CAPOC|nr:tetratricopeptide repeat protein [Capnocytophaga ochracea]UZD40338.1 SEL1-like repeat protein [Capnocytophaga ochracea]SQA94294.1 Sel1 repeat [Capnocytophaga ochracea]